MADQDSEMPQGKRAPRVLVLMATFNGAQWVGEQVRSIVAQQKVKLTLNVSDDASTDGTIAVINAASSGATLQVMCSNKSSGSAAKNFFRAIQAADISDQDFVALSDQDDIWEPGKLARATECLANSAAVAYSSSVEAFWPDGRTKLLTQRRTITASDYIFEGAGQGCTFVMRAQFFSQIQRHLAMHSAYLMHIHYHDWTLYALCRTQGQLWLFDDWPCMRYRQHSGNDTGARSNRSGIDKRLALIRSGWYGSQVDNIARFCIAVSGESVNGASEYLRRSEAAQGTWLGSLKLSIFLLRHGRRRLTDRLVLAWAAMSGYLKKNGPSLDVDD